MTTEEQKEYNKKYYAEHKADIVKKSVKNNRKVCIYNGKNYSLTGLQRYFKVNDIQDKASDYLEQKVKAKMLKPMEFFYPKTDYPKLVRMLKENGKPIDFDSEDDYHVKLNLKNKNWKISSFKFYRIENKEFGNFNFIIADTDDVWVFHRKNLYLFCRFLYNSPSIKMLSPLYEKTQVKKFVDGRFFYKDFYNFLIGYYYYPVCRAVKSMIDMYENWTGRIDI